MHPTIQQGTKQDTNYFLIMKHLLPNLLALFLLSSCSSYKLPPFAASSAWTLHENVASSEVCGMEINFGGKSVFPITNAGNGEYGLNFINTANLFEAYDPFLRKYMTSAMSKIPLSVDSVEFFMADQYIMFIPGAENKWKPDLVRQADGTELVVEAQPLKSLIQPEDEIWRNCVFDDSRHRLIVVDRLVKNGLRHAIVYIMQGEDSHVPFTSTFHYDVTNRHNTQPVGEHLRALLDITIEASQSEVTALTYNDCIHAADSCFMAADFAGAMKCFERAFTLQEKPQGMHLYNAACAASLAGVADKAFSWLERRLRQEPDWYVDNPSADTDLTHLHSDPRWQTYSDTIIARRDRIEAHFDKQLRAQLQAIGESDQAVRHAFLNAYYTEPRNQAMVDSLTLEMQRVDSINQKAICDILDSKGFVGTEKVGNACGVFWMVIQHAPLELQRKYLPLFRQAAAKGDLAKETVAMMDDRIAMFEGRPQKYGSQIVEGRLYRLLDPEKVDMWRSEMDMQPLDDYLRQMGATR